MNPSSQTAFETLGSEAKSYETESIVEDTLRPPIESRVPPGLIPTLAAPISKRTKSTLRKLKELASLEAVAAQESDLQKLAEQFTQSAARANHKAALEAAITSGDVAKIATLPSETETLEKHHQVHKEIRERLRRLRASAADSVQVVMTKAIESVLTERAEAESALLELYRARKLPEPLPSIIGDSYTRRCQELRNFGQMFGSGGAALGPMLVELVG